MKSSLKQERATEPNGGVAQLGEHLPCKQGVMGSNPIISSREAPTGNLRPSEAGVEDNPRWESLSEAYETKCGLRAHSSAG